MKISDMTTDQLIDELAYYQTSIAAALADNDLGEHQRLTEACQPYGEEYLRRTA